MANDFWEGYICKRIAVDCAPVRCQEGWFVLMIEEFTTHFWKTAGEMSAPLEVFLCFRDEAECKLHVSREYQNDFQKAWT